MELEPGCRAVIVNSKAGNNGVIVTVLNYAADANEGLDNLAARNGDRWYIDTEIMTTSGSKINHAGERVLKRIDDDSRKTVSWGSCVFIPSKIKEVV